MRALPRLISFSSASLLNDAPIGPELAVEVAAAAQDVGLHKLHDGVELAQVVLDGRPCEDHPSLGADAIQRAVRRSGGVLESVALVADHHVGAATREDLVDVSPVFSPYSVPSESRDGPATDDNDDDEDEDEDLRSERRRGGSAPFFRLPFLACAGAVLSRKL